MSDVKPHYKLVLDPNYDFESNSRFKESCQAELKNFEYAANIIGKAKGWGGNPRWDLIIEKGLEALINEKK